MTSVPPRPTIREVAGRAGVAVSSVSRVLNDHPDVSRRMRERVRAAIEELGYEPNLLAAGLRKGSSRTVGFVVSDLHNPLFASMITGAQRVLGPRSYAAVIAASGGEADQDAEMAGVLRRRRVDALVASLADETNHRVIRELERFEGPVVLLDRRVDGLANASAVETDHESGMNQAARLLLDLGHRRIALLTGPIRVHPSVRRVEAFRRAYEERGLSAPEDLIRPGGFAPEVGEELTFEMLRSPSPPTAFIAGGNQLLTGVLRSLRRLGLGAGRDIALVSCDDVPLSELHDPPITVIDRDVLRIGETAARLALERIEDPARPPRRVVLPTSLVLRSSTPELPFL